MYATKCTKWRIACALLSVVLFIGMLSITPQTASATSEVSGPSYQQAYDRMVALQKEYPEGRTWTNSDPYGPGKPEPHYRWKGGPIDGKNIVSVGCAAFAFILSDAAFGNLPNRTVQAGQIKLENVRVGDVLRVNGNSHVVIVLKVTAGGVIIAEGNYNGTVHWGRAMSRAEVEGADLLLTRYRVGYSEDVKTDEEKASGQEGGLTWSLTNSGVLTISGTGVIPDFDVNAGEAPTWNQYKEDISTVVIGEGVTSIGDYAFYKNENLLSVYIPNTVENIGTSAFQETGLVAVTLPGSVKSIGANAFRSCGSLTSASVSEGLTTIGDNAFRACESLQYIDFPASITSVGAGAFESCSKMVSIRFKPGTGNVTIGGGAFAQCWMLSSVTLPQGLEKISDDMFLSCKMLSEIYIPASVTSIGETSGNNPFASTAIKSGAGIRYGGTETAWKNGGGQFVLIQMQYPPIEYNAEFIDPFGVAGGDDGITADPEAHQHNWSDAWSKDENGHWHDCTVDGCNITDNSQKDNYGIHSYGEWVVDTEAVAGQAGSRHRVCTTCGYTETENIPEDSSPSPSESPLPSESVTPDPSPSVSPSPTPDSSESPSPTQVPGESPAPDPSGSPNPTQVPGESPSPTQIPSESPSPIPAPSGSPSPTQIPNESPSPLPTSSPSLEEGKTFTSSKVTYQVTKSGKEVELKKIRSTSSKMTVNTVTGTDGVEYKVTSIAPNAMKDNKKLKNLTIGDNVKHIKANAFAGCTNLKTVNIGKNVTTIRSGAFKGCTSLKRTVTIPDSIKKIGSGAFAGCTNLKTVNIGGTSRSDLTRIRKNAFNGCEKLSKVTIKSTKLRSVEEKAFKGTRSDLKVKVPSKQLTKYRKMLKNAGLKAKQVTK